MKLTYQEWLEQVIEELGTYKRNPLALALYKDLTSGQPIGENTERILKESYKNNIPPEDLIDEMM